MDRTPLVQKIVTQAQALMNIIERYVEFYQQTTHFKVYRACNQLGFKVCNYAHEQTVSERPSFMLANDYVSEAMIEEAFQVIPGLTPEEVARDKSIVKEGMKNIVQDVTTLIALPLPAIRNTQQPLYDKITTNLANMLVIIKRYYDFYAQTKYTNTCQACADIRRNLLLYSNRQLWPMDKKVLAVLLTENPITADMVNKAFSKAPGLVEADIIRDKRIIKEGLSELLKDAQTLMNS